MHPRGERRCGRAHDRVRTHLMDVHSFPQNVGAEHTRQNVRAQVTPIEIVDEQGEHLERAHVDARVEQVGAHCHFARTRHRIEQLEGQVEPRRRGRALFVAGGRALFVVGGGLALGARYDAIGQRLVVKQPAGGRIDDEHGTVVAAADAMACRHAREAGGHQRVLILLARGAVGRDERGQREVGDQVAGRQHKLPLDDVRLEDFTQRVARREAGRARGDAAQRRRRKARLDGGQVGLDRLGAMAREDEHLLHPAGTEKLQSVLEQRRVGQRHQRLGPVKRGGAELARA
mmetsp:Transcript_15761/g.40176  ORF Transcript_15761/g.40176 Transcript_15761/m.40176 type:complete len:288 (-) Transcript_15761:98-961(-)